MSSLCLRPTLTDRIFGIMHHRIENATKTTRLSCNNHKRASLKQMDKSESEFEVIFFKVKKKNSVTKRNNAKLFTEL